MERKSCKNEHACLISRGNVTEFGVRESLQFIKIVAKEVE